MHILSRIPINQKVVDTPPESKKLIKGDRARVLCKAHRDVLQFFCAEEYLFERHPPGSAQSMMLHTQAWNWPKVYYVLWRYDMDKIGRTRSENRTKLLNIKQKEQELRLKLNNGSGNPQDLTSAREERSELEAVLHQTKLMEQRLEGERRNQEYALQMNIAKLHKDRAGWALEEVLKYIEEKLEDEGCPKLHGKYGC